MIRNILFDLDNTLFDFDKAEALAVRRTLLELGVDPTPAVVSPLQPAEPGSVEASGAGATDPTGGKTPPVSAAL